MGSRRCSTPVEPQGAESHVQMGKVRQRKKEVPMCRWVNETKEASVSHLEIKCQTKKESGSNIELEKVKQRDEEVPFRNGRSRQGKKLNLLRRWER